MNISLTYNDQQIHVQSSIHDISAPNIIFIMTPIVSVSHKISQDFMAGLTGKGCNIFALDFPGIGRSEGNTRNITYENMAEATLCLISYIQKSCSSSIHLYGGTGTGGIIAQALVSDSRIAPLITSFSQFGSAVYRDSSPLADTRLMKTAYPLIKLIAAISPSLRLSFSPPKYKGLNAIEENLWYKKIMQEYPGTFNMPFSLVHTLCYLILDSKSPMRNPPACPVLVMASKDDRYFSREYVNIYYDSIPNRKNLKWIASSHLAFLWNAEEINQAVIDWVLMNSNGEQK